MRKLILGLVGASALAISSAASAVVIIPGAPAPPNDPSTVFITTPLEVTPDFIGVITATIGHTGIGAGAFSDTFAFTIGTAGMGPIGTGSGNITTGVNIADFLGTPDLDITSVIVNGVMASLQLQDEGHNNCAVRDLAPGGGTCGANEFWSGNGSIITGGALNTIVVSGLSRGQGSYGGNLTFTPNAVPEPATWAMLLVGFGTIGFSMRRRRAAALTQLA